MRPVVGTRYLIDTNTLSEPQKPRPDEDFMAFAEAMPEDAGFVSVISLGELNRGIVGLPASKRREDLSIWFDQVRLHYRDRTVEIDAEIALRWGQLTAVMRAKGRQLKPAGGLIATTALCRDMTIVTRNVSDFEWTDAEVVNPWGNVV